MHQRAAGVRARSTLCHAAPSSRLNAAKKLSATAFVERFADAAHRLADGLPGRADDLSELRDPLETQLADKTDGWRIVVSWLRRLPASIPVLNPTRADYRRPDR
jgi:hypothetical protein